MKASNPKKSLGEERPINIQRENYHKVQPELEVITVEHFNETDVPFTDDKLSVDWDLYSQLHKSGVIRVYTIRCGDELVGYSCIIIHKNPHSKGSTIGATDTIFVKESFRKSGVGTSLISFMEKDLLGVCDTMTVSMKSWLPFDKLLEGLGYKETERIYTTRLR